MVSSLIYTRTLSRYGNNFILPYLFIFRGTNVKHKTNQPARKSLFSDSDSSMKSSVVAPPLNNSGKTYKSILPAVKLKIT